MLVLVVNSGAFRAASGQRGRVGGGTACPAATPDTCTGTTGAFCVNLKTDVNFCGTCTTACPKTGIAVCQNGVCNGTPPLLFCEQQASNPPLETTDWRPSGSFYCEGQAWLTCHCMGDRQGTARGPKGLVCEDSCKDSSGTRGSKRRQAGARGGAQALHKEAKKNTPRMHTSKFLCFRQPNMAALNC